MCFSFSPVTSIWNIFIFTEWLTNSILQWLRHLTIKMISIPWTIFIECILLRDQTDWLIVYHLMQLREIYNKQFVLLKITTCFDHFIWSSSGDTNIYWVLYWIARCFTSYMGICRIQDTDAQIYRKHSMCYMYSIKEEWWTRWKVSISTKHINKEYIWTKH
jgi:hypothetical protein